MPSSEPWRGTRAIWAPKLAPAPEIQGACPHPHRARAAGVRPRRHRNAEQADRGQLGIGEKTVKVHRARVMEKMRAGSVAALVRLADGVGLIVTKA